ncbi:MAG: RluA family pseudouridine synthase [Paracoccaceae bacterium]
MPSRPVSADTGALPSQDRIDVTVPETLAGDLRLDKALALAASAQAGLSRSRIAALIASGEVRDANGRVVDDPSRKVKAGARFALRLPPPAPATPVAEAIPLCVLHEDPDLLVVDKPAGMVVHPGAGIERGTLVNALLHHCGDRLPGIGGTARPGIVHRIDKDTSGLLVVAKTDRAQAGLSEQFADHSIDRRYVAICDRIPDPAHARHPSRLVEGWLRIETGIDRHPTDRTRMAVVAAGRRAVTHLHVDERFSSEGRGVAARLSCRLETGRTHQIRVHAAHIGHPLIGDPIYGRSRQRPATLDPATRDALQHFPRQALHAARLGFVHPGTGRRLAFDAPMPADMAQLLDILRRTSDGIG